MDLEKEISKALADPDIMNKVQSVLSSMGTGESEDNNKEDSLPISPNVLSALTSQVNDDRTRLLLAIKPFLSEKRAPYMDSALTVLKLASVGKLSKDLKLF